ncbi:hypothetical protein [Sporomusa aerivorans]|uniref:hypothetical protein n=1 Tax=Sporomusa aerivorans TaxID=204936 RepID=UPI00352BC27E
MKWSKKLVCALLVCYFVLAIGGAAFAMGNPPEKMGDPKPLSVMANEKLTKLVEDGIISQEQKEGVVAFLKERDVEMKDKKPPCEKPQDKDMRKHHQEMLSAIQKAGKLTAEQAKAVDEALKPPAPPQDRPESFR